MKNISELIVVEFSLSQNAFHRHTVEDMVSMNTDSIIIKKKTNDYLPVGIFETEQQASNFIKDNYDSFKKQ